MPSLEIAAFTIRSAILASQSGANRIELCRSQKDGGLTPSLSDFKTLRSSSSLPVNVMIRPHSRSFVYSNEDILQMEGQIEMFDEAGADGFVFGCLNGEGLVDEENNLRLLQVVGGKPCTFHRAFDEVPVEKVEEELEVLIRLGFKSVLTSGGTMNSIEGKNLLKILIGRARGRIDVIVGGGVRSTNVKELRHVTRAEWFHSSAVVDGGEVCSEGEIHGLRGLLND